MSEPRFTLTERGRIRAVLATLEQRWSTLTAEQRAEALTLLDRLAETYRGARAVRVPLVGRLVV